MDIETSVEFLPAHRPHEFEADKKQGLVEHDGSIYLIGKDLRLGDTVDDMDELTIMLNNPEKFPFLHGLAESEEYKLEARRRHAIEFERRGFVDPRDIDSNGCLSERVDPYVSRSDYFISLSPEDGSVAATTRQIRANGRGFASFQFFEKAENSELIQRFDGKYDPKKCVEISALAKEPGAPKIATYHLYRDMLRHSKSQGHELWMMTINTQAFYLLKGLFGDALEPAGGVSVMPDYQSTQVVPTVLYPASAFDIFSSSNTSEDEGVMEFYEATLSFFKNLDSTVQRIR